MTYDLILAGTGLANGLIAWRLRQCRPELNILCLDQADALGGSHTWSFHTTDLTPHQQQWIAPFVAQRWSSYRVHFPAYSRTLPSGYASITGERFAQVLTDALGDALWLNQSIHSLTPTEVRLADGRHLRAKVVIDGRGAPRSPHLVLGHQAFLGQLVRLERPHGLTAPIIMDARVAQHDGYRFVYVLPFSADTVLIEDTHYVDQHRTSAEQLRAHIAEYAQQQGWTIVDCLREEHGVLPITLAGDIEAFWNAAQGQPLSGLRAGLYHSTTGYSLPDAVRLADWLVTQPLDDAAALGADLRAYAHEHWRTQGFYRLLNRMLFLAGRPEQRWQVMQRFYQLPDGLIERFYAGRNTWRDRSRILMGKPPVPVGEAVVAAWRHSPRYFKEHR